MPVQAIDDARIARFTPKNLGAENRERLRLALQDRLIDADELETAMNLLSYYQGTPQSREAFRYARTIQTMYVDQHMRGALADERSTDHLLADLGFNASPFDAAGTEAYRSGLNNGGLMHSLAAMQPEEVATIVDRMSDVFGGVRPDFSRAKLAARMMRYKGHIPLNPAAAHQLRASLPAEKRPEFDAWYWQNAARAPV